jgi:uncharacterized membrane protein
LNRVPGTDWLIADGAEAFVGHEILNWLENGMLKRTDGRVNEFGFYIDMPGSFNGVSFLMSDLVMSVPRKVGEADRTIKVPALGLDAGQLYAPEISFRDATGLGGMSFDDRKLFLTSVQSIIDRVLPDMGVDARQFSYLIVHSSTDGFQSVKPSLMLSGGWLSDEQRNTLTQALDQNRQLFELMQRADMSGNKGLGEFTMSVLDANGNALAKDQVRLISGGKSVVTSIDTIRDMNQQQIFAFINRH